MKTLRPCKHLDYTEGKFGPDITLKTFDPDLIRAWLDARKPSVKPPDAKSIQDVAEAQDYPDVRYWHRGSIWTDNGPDEQPNPANVQFCGAGRGRINGIFQCYNGEMHCYEPAEVEEGAA